MIIIKQKTRSKFLIVLNTILLIALFAIPAYAFIWGESTAKENIKIEVGVEDGLEIKNQTWTHGKGKVLIPQDAIATRENEVKTLDYTMVLENKNNNQEIEVEIDVTGIQGLNLVITKGGDTIENGYAFKLKGSANFTFTFTIAKGSESEYTPIENLTVNIKFTIVTVTITE